MYRLLILVQIIYAVFFFNKGLLNEKDKSVLGDQTSLLNELRNEESLTISLGENLDQEYRFIGTPSPTQISTQTAFAQKEVVDSIPIEYETERIDDEDLEYGKEEVQQAGKNGEKITTYLVTHWLDEEIDRVLLKTEVKEPKTEIVSVGKKISWHEFDTPDIGEIKYWAKVRVFATKYDSTCLGCNNTTALGAPVQEGVCATDPKTIPLYTHFYVPGYGKCQALDVGGLIKGNRIDLAFRDAKTAAWGAEYVDIYLMDNAPTD